VDNTNGINSDEFDDDEDEQRVDENASYVRRLIENEWFCEQEGMPPPLKNIIKENLQSLREESRLTQSRLGYILGDIGRATISKYERGLQPVPAIVLRLMCEYYDVSADYILGLSYDRKHADANIGRLGLSSSAVAFLEKIARDSSQRKTLEAINYLLINEDKSNLLAQIGEYIADPAFLEESDFEKKEFYKAYRDTISGDSNCLVRPPADGKPERIIRKADNLEPVDTTFKV